MPPTFSFTFIYLRRYWAHQKVTSSFAWVVSYTFIHAVKTDGKTYYNHPTLPTTHSPSHQRSTRFLFWQFFSYANVIPEHDTCNEAWRWRCAKWLRYESLTKSYSKWATLAGLPFVYLLLFQLRHICTHKEDASQHFIPLYCKILCCSPDPSESGVTLPERCISQNDWTDTTVGSCLSVI